MPEGGNSQTPVCWMLTAAFPIVAGIVVALLRSCFPEYLMSSLLLLAMPVIPIWSLIVIILMSVACFERQWRWLGLYLCVLAGSIPATALAAVSGDYIHLFLMYPYYENVILRDPQGEVRPIRFSWGDAAVTVLDGWQPRTLIYDASGETENWMGKSRNSPYEPAVAIEVTHLLGNFYVELMFSH